MLYQSRQTTLVWPVSDSHDASDKKYYVIQYRPGAWVSATAITLGSFARATTYNGCYYQCTQPGIAGATEPVWSTVKDALITDGTVIWKCIHDTLPVRQGDAITTSTWTGPTGTTFDNSGISGSGTVTKTRVTAIPADVSVLQVTNHITVTRADATTEELDVSLRITVADL